MQFIVIGITDETRPELSSEVTKTISASTVFSGGKRHHELMDSYLPASAQWIDITVPLTNVFEVYRKHFTASPDTPIVVFASGDPLFFGFAVTLQREFPDAQIRLFPSFNSLQTLAHRLVLPYHDMHIVSTPIGSRCPHMAQQRGESTSSMRRSISEIIVNTYFVDTNVNLSRFESAAHGKSHQFHLQFVGR